MSRSILIVGHSHLGAYRVAAKARRIDHPGGPTIKTVYLRDPAFSSEMEDGDFSPEVKAAIQIAIADDDPILASAVGGNSHAALTLIARERIDFVLSDDDALPIDGEAKIISEAEMANRLRPGLEHDLIRLRLLRALIGPFWHLESPPPVRRKDWIEEKAEASFTANSAFRQFGVAEAGIRYRAWRLANRIIRAELDRLGCCYVPVPRHVCGEAGMLRPSHARDATHGNQQFGEQMLRELETAAVK